MNNIIYVDFKKENKSTELLDGPLARYLAKCKEFLDNDDYSDLLEAIYDYKFYTTCDSEIQQLVDGYYNIISSQK